MQPATLKKSSSPSFLRDKYQVIASSISEINSDANFRKVINQIKSISLTKEEALICLDVIDSLQKYLVDNLSLASEELFTKALDQKFGSGCCLFFLMPDLISLGIHKNVQTRWLLPRNYFGYTNYTAELKEVVNVIKGKVKTIADFFDAVCNSDVEKLKLLNLKFLENKINFSTTENGFTALYIAVSRGSKEVVEILLQILTYAEIVKQHKKGDTALHFAIHKKNKDIFHQLVRAELRHKNLPKKEIKAVLLDNDVPNEISSIVLEYMDLARDEKKILEKKVEKIKKEVVSSFPDFPAFDINPSGRLCVYYLGSSSDSSGYFSSSSHRLTSASLSSSLPNSCLVTLNRF